MCAPPAAEAMAAAAAVALVVASLVEVAAKLADGRVVADDDARAIARTTTILAKNLRHEYCRNLR